LIRERPITEEETKRSKRRKWTVNSTITKEERSISCFTDPEGNGPLFEMIIQKREYVTLGLLESPHDASLELANATDTVKEFWISFGICLTRDISENYDLKSISVFESVKDLHIESAIDFIDIVNKSNWKKNNIVLFIDNASLELANATDTVKEFWISFGICLTRDISENYDLKSISVFESVKDLHIESAIDFIDIVNKSNWKKNNIVLFIDKFDKLCDSNMDVKSSCLETLHGIKNAKENYAFWSVVTIGTFGITHLESGKVSTAPFNICEPFLNPNFILEQVQFLFKEFEKDYTLTIDPEIIEDIYKQSNDRRVNFVEWTKLVTKSIDNQMIDYSTFRKMVEMLNTNNRVKPAMGLLRSMFLGFFDFVPIYDKEELRLAEFLVALGNEKTKNEFKMSSVFIDALIQKQVITVLYKSCPTIPVPRTNEGTLKTLDILKETIHCFDKTIIYNAFNRSFKTALVTVNNQCNVRVPRESVYDTELNRILVNWIVKECNLEVTGQWHLIDEKDKHNYSDIIITSQHQIVILEILATVTKRTQ
ncbi:17731_t:CDS:2, partial [Entrophospora sp. SA101]